ncbi:non-homologous end joining protein Ku [Lacipirellula limnantheis]|uniref:Non-homologous end joining protein Ku n=1 Tax=Lacipirellula limnantheis TaxID=2528024 RepID=A0A517U1I5_9BACT|nr:Ku protein [Lacipirellula limnantheis]QDT74484.1 putative DNA repair protein YkoV [Lacipirellula limnantheis]
MPRPSWKGHIRLSLVSVPVEGYTVAAGGDSHIALNQLHRGCGARIRYKKVCEVHGEVTQADIVKGYEYANDQYAVIDPEEINQLRTDADRAINIDRFVKPEQLDPIYFSGANYYLMPSGRAGEKPYALLQKAMAAEDVIGIAQAVISNREQLVALRPLGNLLTASVLNYASEMRRGEEFEKDLHDGEVVAAEVKLARTLILATRAKEPELESYHDLYNERLRELIDAKVAGQEVSRPPSRALPPTINIMEALRASLQKRARGAPKTVAKKTPKRPPVKKRKTG